MGKSVLQIYQESPFYNEYKDTYISDKILREVFGCELKLHRLYGVKTYEQAHQLNTKVMLDILNLFSKPSNINDDNILWDMIYAFYLDPDGYDVRTIGGVSCSADGLLSIKRICRKYGVSEEGIREYERYRKIPIFFFPQERNGINMARASVFGDKIDATLFDLKRKFEGSTHRLAKAYDLPKTSKWIESIGDFKKLVDIYGIKGIFVDDDYNVFDLEKCNGSVITEYSNDYSWNWSDAYYQHLKFKIDEFMNK